MERQVNPTPEDAGQTYKNELTQGNFDSFIQRRRAWFKNGILFGSIAGLTSAADLMLQGGAHWFEWYIIGAHTGLSSFTLVGAHYNLENPVSFKGSNNISNTLSLLEGSSGLLAVSLINVAVQKGDMEMLMAGLTLSKANLIVTVAHTIAGRIVNKLNTSPNISV